MKSETAKRINSPLLRKNNRHFHTTASKSMNKAYQNKLYLQGITISIIVVLTVITYLNCLLNQFVYDDTSTIAENQLIKDWGNFPTLFTHDYFKYSGELTYRPLVTLSYFIDYSLWHMNPMGYHIVNVVLHTINVTLMYFFVILLFRQYDRSMKQCNHGEIANIGLALLTCVLFAIHPIVSEVVNVISYREDLFATAFFTTSFLLFLLYKERVVTQIYSNPILGKRDLEGFSFSRPFHKGTVFLSTGAIIAYFFALLSKESAIVLPAVIFLFDLLLNAGVRPNGSSSPFFSLYKAVSTIMRSPIFLGYTGISIAYLIIRFIIFHNPQEKIAYPEGSFFVNMLTMTKVLGRYIANIFLPLNLNADYHVLYLNTPLTLSFIIPLFMLISIAIIAIRLREKMVALPFHSFRGGTLTVGGEQSSPVFTKDNENLHKSSHCSPSVWGGETMGTPIPPHFDSRGEEECAAVAYPPPVEGDEGKWENTRAASLSLLGGGKGGGGGMVKKRYPYPVMLFAILWFFISILPILNIIPLANIMADRYLYSAIFGFCLFLSTTLLHLRVSIRYPLIVSLIIFYIFTTIIRNRVWRDEFTLWYNSSQSPLCSFTTYNNLGTQYNKKGYPDMALQCYQKALQKAREVGFTQYAAVYYNIGNAYEKKNLPNQAVTAYKKAIEIKPDYQQAHNNLGKVYFTLDRYADAIAEYNTAILLDPNFAYAYNNLGVLYNKLGRQEDAMIAYKKALSLDPQYGDAYYNLGNIYEARKQYDLALEAYQAAVKLDPAQVYVHNNLGTIYDKKGRLEYAIAEYRYAIRLDPTYPYSHNNLGASLTKKGDMDGALIEFQKAVDLLPDQPDFHFNIGYTYLKKGDLDSAMKEFEITRRLAPSHTEAIFCIGTIYYRQGDKEKAEKSWRAVLELNPNHVKARKCLEMLSEG